VPRPSTTGATVCNKHGGQLPNVKAKAARVLLEELVEPALIALRDIVTDKKQPAAARVAAARDILDRTGYKPALEVQGIPSVAMFDKWIAELEGV